MNNHIETIEKNNYKIVTWYDEADNNPRQWDNVGTIALWHPRYNFANESPFEDPNDFMEWLTDEKEVQGDKLIVLPVIMYDHSGIGFNTTRDQYPYNCPWDSSHIGYIYAKKGKDGLSEENIRNILHHEVVLYGEYCNGEVYGFSIINFKDDVVDSYGGFIGHEGYKDMLVGAEELLNWHAKNDYKEKFTMGGL